MHAKPFTYESMSKKSKKHINKEFQLFTTRQLNLFYFFLDKISSLKKLF